MTVMPMPQLRKWEKLQHTQIYSTSSLNGEIIYNRGHKEINEEEYSYITNIGDSTQIASDQSGYAVIRDENEEKNVESEGEGDGGWSATNMESCYHGGYEIETDRYDDEKNDGNQADGEPQTEEHCDSEEHTTAEVREKEKEGSVKVCGKLF